MLRVKIKKARVKRLNFFHINFTGFFIYIICGGLCIWQVSNCIYRYCYQSVVTNVQLQYVDVFTRPPITICQAKMPVEEVFDKFKKKYGNFTNHELIIHSPKYLWKILSPVNNLNISYRIPPCSYAYNVSSCVENWKKRSSVQYFLSESVTGQCRGLVEKNKFHFVLTKTGTYVLLIQPFSTKTVDSKIYLKELTFIINSTQPVLTLSSFFSGHRIRYPGRAFISILSMTELERINNTNQPCRNGLEVYHQEIACINNYMNQRMPCGLPFLKSRNLTKCSTIADFKSAILKTKQLIYEGMTNFCPVQKVCNEIVYKTHTQWKSSRYLTVHIRFLNNMKFVVKELYAYSLLDLSTDVTGNLGFFLGLSLIGVLKRGSWLLFKRKSDRVLQMSKKQMKVLSMHVIFDSTFLGICGILCSWQVGVCMHRFFTSPTVHGISIEHFETFNFPAVAICATDCLFNYYLYEVLIHYFVLSDVKPKTRKILKTTPFTSMNLSLEQLATVIGISDTNIETDPANCLFSTNQSYCQALEAAGNAVKRTPFFIPSGGRCLKFHLDVEYRNVLLTTWPFLLNKMFFLPSINLTQFTLLIDSPHMINHYTYLTIANNREFIVQLRDKFYNFDVLIQWITKTIVLNTTKNPCVTETEAMNYYTECMDKHLNDKITCGLIYINSSKQPCQTWTNYHRSQYSAFKWISNQALNKCQMPKICEKTIYRYVMESQMIVSNETQQSSTINVKFMENIIETISEKYSYTTSAYFADISNYLGFFLDLSLIHIFTIIIQFVYYSFNLLV